MARRVSWPPTAAPATLLFRSPTALIHPENSACGDRSNPGDLWRYQEELQGARSGRRIDYDSRAGLAPAAVTSGSFANSATARFKSHVECVADARRVNMVNGRPASRSL